ncbi:MAG: hypothetical protein AABY22_20010 [Nanoarchaeota archaeon]
MKKEEFKGLINECIREVMAEGKVAKKKAALKQIKEIISENELGEADLAEAGFGDFVNKVKTAVGPKPVSDADIDAYLASRPKDKAILDKDTDRKTKFYAFVKSNKDAGAKVKAKEVVLAFWDPAKKEYSAQKSTSSNTATSFGEGKKK